jgi:catechol 2,3-dioxygenase-like lactoylglutathione lyase family enzyme
MDHNALLVKDLEVASQFYMDILGLKEISNGGLPSHIRWFQFNDKVQIHLSGSVEDIHKKKGVHIAIRTQNLDQFITFLNSKNIHWENWPGGKSTTRIRPDGVKQIYIRDPDGYWIEINDNELQYNE